MKGENEMSLGFNLTKEKLEVSVMPKEKFNELFYYTRIKIYDPDGAILNKRMDFPIVMSIEEARVNGASDLFIMLLNKEIANAISKNQKSFEDVGNSLAKCFKVDIKDIIEKDMVVYAKVKTHSFVNKFAACLNFDPVNKNSQKGADS